MREAVAALRNNQSPETVVRRLLASRPLPQVYESCQSHDLPERHRHTARGVLRGRFAGASPDERVHLILPTEGRALGTLSGLREAPSCCPVPTGSRR